MVFKRTFALIMSLAVIASLAVSVSAEDFTTQAPEPIEGEISSPADSAADSEEGISPRDAEGEATDEVGVTEAATAAITESIFVTNTPTSSADISVGNSIIDIDSGSNTPAIREAKADEKANFICCDCSARIIVANPLAKPRSCVRLDCVPSIVGKPAFAWETGRYEDDKADWSCGNCKIKMTGGEPKNCLNCGSEDINKTFGNFVRDLLGNVRSEKDGFDRPIMDPTVAFFIIIISAFILGMLMSILYKSVTRKGQPSSKNFATTLVILPMVVAAAIFAIGENTAAGFGIAGLFAMTRFRSNATNSKDLSFVFVSVAIGLSCGIGFVFYAFALAVILCMILLILNVSAYGEPKSEPKLLRINVPESISYGEVFDTVLEKYAYSWDISRVKTVDLGATFEITYTLSLKKGINEKEFIDELRTRNGNLNIILRLDDRRESNR